MGVDDDIVEGGEARQSFNVNISWCLGLVRALSASYADSAQSRTKKYCMVVVIDWSRDIYWWSFIGSCGKQKKEEF
ncbi:hypothetical protein [Noviherbaspirillum aerium]|uniref:hypothetical protein n=1 Tax=Noviherbaspirillum aerium TaxID=2588497 RepID=UPI00124C3905|nr:hypothetical protein [Noviherbaspirillum aerium]